MELSIIKREVERAEHVVEQMQERGDQTAQNETHNVHPVFRANERELPRSNLNLSPLPPDLQEQAPEVSVPTRLQLLSEKQSEVSWQDVAYLHTCVSMLACELQLRLE